jgi:hypothetical protein
MTSDVAASAQFQSEIDCHDSAENHMKAAFPLCFFFSVGAPFLLRRRYRKLYPYEAGISVGSPTGRHSLPITTYGKVCQKGGLGLEDTFFATDRSVPQCLRLVRPDFGERNLQTHDAMIAFLLLTRFEGLNFAEEEPT